MKVVCPKFFFTVLTLVLASVCALSQSLLFDTYTDRAKLAYRNGDLESAEKLFKAALVEATNTGDDALIATGNVNLGKVYQSQGRFDLAEPLYLKAIGIFDRLDGDGGERSAFAISNLGLLYSDKKLYSKSEEYLRRALSIREKLLGADDPDVAVTILNIGKLYSDQEKHTEADAVYVRALGILIRHPDLVEEILPCLHDLALTTKALNNPKRTEAAYKMSVSIIEKNFGKNSTRLTEPLTNYAAFLRTTKRTAEAVALERRIKLLK